MSVEKRRTAAGTTTWRVRWRESGRNRAKTFDRKRDAELFEAEIRRRSAMGTLGQLDNGRITLDQYVTETWVPVHASQLAKSTRATYSALYSHHVADQLGDVELRALTPQRLARWQADRLAAGGGPTAVRRALVLVGGILQRAVEEELLQTNAARAVRKVARPRREEVRPLAPVTVEAMRAAVSPRDATLLSVMAYAGLRPGEALALRWRDVRDRTLLVERAVSMGEEKATKTGASRAVRLLAPLSSDLKAWRLASPTSGADDLLFPAAGGELWTKVDYQNWSNRNFRRALDAAGVTNATPYAARHSFASLLLHEGRSVIYVARQLGHDATLTLSVYGHVIDELDDAPRKDAEEAIREARTRQVPAGFAEVG